MQKKQVLPGRRNKLLLYSVVMSLSVLQLFVFWVIVNFNSILLSFKTYENVAGSYVETIVWFKNITDTYVKMFTEDKFITCIWNSLLFYGISTLGGTVVSLSFSYYIYKKGLLGGFFKVNNTTKYEIKYFNPDKFNFTDLFVVTETEVPDNVGMSDALYVITGFEEILVDGDPYPVVEGSVDGFMNLSFLGNRADIFDGLKIGDVIKFNLDDEGRIKYIDTTNLISLAGDTFRHKQHTR